MSASDIESRLSTIRASIARASERVGRADDITLVAVSKTVEAERLRVALSAGQRVFGENRVQEAVAKIDALAGTELPIEWHFLGHLQTNKVKSVVARFACIESVDSVRLATELDRRARDAGRRISVLLEVNVAGETSKSGFDPDTVERSVPTLLGLPSLDLRGLMTVAPNADDPEDVRWVFQRLRALRDRIREAHGPLQFSQLSMGMSNDYPVAIEEGATIVRIGRALFGDRPPVPGTR